MAYVHKNRSWEAMQKLMMHLRYGSRRSKVSAKRTLRSGCSSEEALASFKSIRANRRWVQQQSK